jgi:hypothetical protein
LSNFPYQEINNPPNDSTQDNAIAYESFIKELEKYMNQGNHDFHSEKLSIYSKYKEMLKTLDYVV